MDTCPVCYYPLDACDCDEDLVHYASRNREALAEMDRQSQENAAYNARRAREHRLVQETMQYQYVQVNDDDNSRRS